MSFLVDEQIEEYAERHTTPPDPLLAALAEETKATMSAPQMLTGPIEGRFLELLVFGTGAKRVLEIGTFTGYSALSMAAALPAGRAHRHARHRAASHAEVAQRYFDRSPYADGSRSTSGRRSRRSRSSRASSTSSSSTRTSRTTTRTTRPCCRGSPSAG